MSGLFLRLYLFTKAGEMPIQPSLISKSFQQPKLTPFAPSKPSLHHLQPVGETCLAVCPNHWCQFIIA